MGEQQRFGWAVALSLLAHVGLWWWLAPESDIAHPPVRFDVVLVPTEPLLPEEQDSPQVSPDPEPLPPEPPAPPIPVEDPPEPVAETPVAELDEDRVADVPHQPPEAPATRLNLEKPENWDELVRSLPGPGTTLAFNPGLSEALRSRKAVQRRKALVAQRASAIYGVTDEQYARSGPLGDEMKLDGGCVILAEDKGVEEGTRWWASQCTDTQQNPFMLPTIEYDALGRAIVD